MIILTADLIQALSVITFLPFVVYFFYPISHLISKQLLCTLAFVLAYY